MMAKVVKHPTTYDLKPARLTLYRWAGKWGPFKVKIPCGECTLTTDIVKDVLANELDGVPVELEVKDWLSHVIEATMKGARHAPVVLLNGRVISQGVAVNRGLLAEAVIAEHVQHFPVDGTHVYGKENCGYCTKAKAALDTAGIGYVYHDVVRNPGLMASMSVAMMLLWRDWALNPRNALPQQRDGHAPPCICHVRRHRDSRVSSDGIRKRRNH